MHGKSNDTSIGMAVGKLFISCELQAILLSSDIMTRTATNVVSPAEQSRSVFALMQFARGSELDSNRAVAEPKNHATLRLRKQDEAARTALDNSRYGFVRSVIMTKH